MEEELKPITDFDGKVYTIEQALQRHQGFLWSLANKYASSGKEYSLDKQDLLSIAKMGLVKAFKKFDSGAGVKFITYMSRCSENEVLMALRNGATATGKWGLARHRAKVFYEKFPEQKPSIDKIMEATGCDYNGAVKVIDFMLRRHGQSLDAEMSVHNGEDNVTFGDMVGKNADYTRIHLSEYFEVLDTRERQIVDLMLEDKDQKAIGKALGVSQSYISRLVGRIKFKMEKVQKGEIVMAKYSKADIEKAKDLLRAGKPVREVVKLTGMPQASVYYYNGQVELEKKKANATAKPQASKKDLPTPKAKAVTPDEVAQAKPVKQDETLREKHVIGIHNLKDNPVVNLPEIIENLKKQLTAAQNEAKSHKAELDNAQNIVLAQQERAKQDKVTIENMRDVQANLENLSHKLISEKDDYKKKLEASNAKVKELMVREQDVINERDEFEMKVGKLEPIIVKLTNAVADYDKRLKEGDGELRTRWEKAQAVIEKQFNELETANEAVLVADQCVAVRDETIAKLQAEIEELKKQPAQEPVEEYTIALPATDFEKVARELQEYANSLEAKIEDYRTIAKKAVNLL